MATLLNEGSSSDGDAVSMASVLLALLRRLTRPTLAIGRRLVFCSGWPIKLYLIILPQSLASSGLRPFFAGLRSTRRELSFEHRKSIAQGTGLSDSTLGATRPDP